jgi:hypothetical protein
MKKNNTKKLALSRETIRALVAGDLEKAAGGIVSSDNQFCSFTLKCQTSSTCGSGATCTCQ